MRIWIVLSILLLSAELSAQRTLSGRIFNEWAEPVPAVEILVPGSELSTRSAEDGSYEIALPSSVVYLSFFGDSSFYWVVENVDIPEEGPFHVMLFSKDRKPKEPTISPVLSDSIHVYGQVIDRLESCPNLGWKNSSYNEPLIGAWIIALGTQIGTVSDIDGGFSLSVPPSVTNLDIGYDGMRSRRPVLPDVPVLYMEAPLMGYQSCEEIEKMQSSKKWQRQQRRRKRKIEKWEKKQENKNQP
jgi:hypothetical protein